MKMKNENCLIELTEFPKTNQAGLTIRLDGKTELISKGVVKFAPEEMNSLVGLTVFFKTCDGYPFSMLEKPSIFIKANEILATE